MDRDERVKAQLAEWTNIMVQNCHNGALTGDPQKPIPISQVFTVPGPRAGALELHAGIRSGTLMRLLSQNDCATLRQFVPWHFRGDPACFMSGRYVRVEAGWPDSLAEKDIKLRDLGKNPKGGGRWIAGKNEIGQTIALGLNDNSPHFLICGTTGSGKSYAMRSAVGQLCKDKDNSIVLIDGKWGEGLGPLFNVRGLVGPLAKDIETAKRALSWCVSEMRHRYENLNGKGPLIVVIDELQELTTQDADFAEFLRRLTTQGRGAKVHCILGTQHPVKAMFGDVSTTKMNIPGRLALKVLDAKASEVAIGSSQPRADHLLGTGDSYCVVPGAVHRAQLAYIPENDLADLPHSEPILDEWPEFDGECLGTLQESTSGFDELETVVSLMCAHYGKGRPFLKNVLAETGRDKPGSSRASRLLAWGKDVNTLLHQYHHRLSLTD